MKREKYKDPIGLSGGWTQGGGGPAMRWWGEGVREEGGPTLYWYHNRTGVPADLPALALVSAALTLYLAFLTIFPGIRKEKFSTFTIVTLSLFVGTVILVCRVGSSWHVGEARVARAAYRAFSADRLDCRLGLHVGLTHLNVTLAAVSWGNETTQTSGVEYNERFSWDGAGGVQAAYHAGLARGLPFPVLSVAEHFVVEHEGFEWGARYRAAGYTTSTLLWFALALWLVMNVLVVAVPRYGAYALVALGAMLCAAAAAYWSSLPRAPLAVRLDGAMLRLTLGWCFWLVLLSGLACVVVGLVFALLDVVWPHRFSTALEVDYDTPYDRHVLIVDSRRRARPHHHTSLPSRILRRLSSKTRETDNPTSGAEEGSAGAAGRTNPAFQPDQRKPNSPWRYPLFRRQINRMDSGTSLASGIHSSALKMSPLAAAPGSAGPTTDHSYKYHPHAASSQVMKDMW